VGFCERFKQMRDQPDFEPAYLHAGITDPTLNPTQGASSFSKWDVSRMSEVSVPSQEADHTLLNLHLSDVGFPSLMFDYAIGACQARWTNDFFCDQSACECPHKYGEWTARMKHPEDLAAKKARLKIQDDWPNLPQDQKDQIIDIFRYVGDRPAYGTGGEWDLESISVYQTMQNEKFVRFNYKSVGTTEQAEHLAVSVPIKVDESGDDTANLVPWMKAVMGPYAANTCMATTTPPAVTTTAKALVPGQTEATKIIFEANVKNVYLGKCEVMTLGGPQHDREDREKVVSSRMACKTECITENTQGEFDGSANVNRQGGSHCEGFSFRVNAPVGEPNNCILHLHQNVTINTKDPTVAKQIANEATQPDGWQCWALEITNKEATGAGKGIAHYQNGAANQPNKGTLSAPRPQRTFYPVRSLSQGYMAKRHRVKALDQVSSDCWPGYTWVEIEPPTAKRRLQSDESWKMQYDIRGNFWKRQVDVGDKGYIPVTQEEWNKLTECLAVVGATMFPAHVAVTDRVCVDAIEEGWCVQQSIDLSCIWIALPLVIAAFIIGYCCNCRGKPVYHAIELDVREVGSHEKGDPTSSVRLGGAAGAKTTLYLEGGGADRPWRAGW
jgi:hypothetical protein